MKKGRVKTPTAIDMEMEGNKDETGEKMVVKARKDVTVPFQSDYGNGRRPVCIETRRRGKGFTLFIDC